MLNLFLNLYKVPRIVDEHHEVETQESDDKRGDGSPIIDQKEEDHHRGDGGEHSDGRGCQVERGKAAGRRRGDFPPDHSIGDAGNELEHSRNDDGHNHLFLVAPEVGIEQHQQAQTRRQTDALSQVCVHYFIHSR